MGLTAIDLLYLSAQTLLDDRTSRAVLQKKILQWLSENDV